MLIRAARAEDAQAICELHVAAIREVCAAHYEAAAVKVWIAGKTAARYVAAMESNVMVVAEADGCEVVGFGDLHVESAEIRAVYVRPDRLRHGIGAALLEAIERAGRERSLRRLQLRSTLNAIEFYRARGYSLDEMTVFELSAGAVLPCARMHKTLAELA